MRPLGHPDLTSDITYFADGEFAGTFACMVCFIARSIIWGGECYFHWTGEDRASKRGGDSP